MSKSFEKASPKKLGYDPSQVDDLISRARRQFQEPTLHLVSASDLRSVEFDLIKGGYQIGAVDSAVERLEDAFVGIEVVANHQALGEEKFSENVEALKNLLIGRTGRGKGRKFSRATWPMRGYSRGQVDQLCQAIQFQIEGGKSIELTQVRNAVFKSKRGGYLESQVDAFIDRAVELLQILAKKP